MYIYLYIYMYIVPPFFQLQEVEASKAAARQAVLSGRDERRKFQDFRGTLGPAGSTPRCTYIARSHIPNVAHY